MSETFPETNTPVQTPSTESFVNKMNAGDKTIGNNISLKIVIVTNKVHIKNRFRLLIHLLLPRKDN